MPVMSVNFDFTTEDQRLYQSALAEFVEELHRGRSHDQIRFDGNRCFIKTPETIYELARRLISRNKLIIDRARIVIVDKSTRKICVLGGCDMRIFETFKSYELIDISECA